MEDKTLWTQARFIETAKEYDLHASLAAFKRETLAAAESVGIPANDKHVVALRAQVAEHDQQVLIHETTLRQFVTRFPLLRSHWAVAELELNFLDP